MTGIAEWVGTVIGAQRWTTGTSARRIQDASSRLC
jgi:hypothetical protein